MHKGLVLKIILGKCQDLSQPSSGAITFETDGSVTRALFTCDIGFTVQGDANSACLADGSWLTTETSCGIFLLKQIGDKCGKSSIKSCWMFNL